MACRSHRNKKIKTNACDETNTSEGNVVQGHRKNNTLVTHHDPREAERLFCQVLTILTNTKCFNNGPTIHPQTGEYTWMNKNKKMESRILVTTGSMVLKCATNSFRNVLCDFCYTVWRAVPLRKDIPHRIEKNMIGKWIIETHNPIAR